MKRRAGPLLRILSFTGNIPGKGERPVALVRLIQEGDLPQLLELYKHLNPDDPVLSIDEKLIAHWREILENPGQLYIGAEEDGRLVASCVLVVIPNMTRSARPYGLIENVVTHPDYRRRGLGKAVLQKAVEIAGVKGCYKVMLMTGRREEGTLRFYEEAGFVRGIKTAFITKP